MLEFALGSLFTALLVAALYIYTKPKREYKIRKDKDNAIRLSRNVNKGHLAETMFPILQKAIYGYHLYDMIFVGKLFDYVIVDGYSDAKDNGGEIRKIIFLDIKTGNAQLSAHQDKLKKAIEQGRVEWKTVVINDRGKLLERK